MAKISPNTIEALEKQKNDILTEELENGPLEKRSCRDILCTLLWFIIFITEIYNTGLLH